MEKVPEEVVNADFSHGGIVRHGYTDYMRDYEIIVCSLLGPPWDDLHKYQFVGCVETHCQSVVDPAMYAASISDLNVTCIDEGDEQPAGFIWGTRSSELPSIDFFKDTASSDAWSRKLAMSCYEARLVTEAYSLKIIFHELRYEFLGRIGQGLSQSKDKPVKAKSSKFSLLDLSEYY